MPSCYPLLYRGNFTIDRANELVWHLSTAVLKEVPSRSTQPYDTVFLYSDEQYPKNIDDMKDLVEATQVQPQAEHVLSHSTHSLQLRVLAAKQQFRQQFLDTAECFSVTQSKAAQLIDLYRSTLADSVSSHVSFLSGLPLIGAASLSCILELNYFY
jgi:hypothetical protein